ncbi:MAG: hypothetical protein JXQ23_01680 [Clostridia bacterium]|nr:hypothetical protein [Clostridia bacterium]
MKKASLFIIIIAIIFSITACAVEKQVSDYMPVKNFLFYSNDTVLYEEVSHSESGYSFNILTRTNDDIAPVLQYYALMMGEYLSGFTGDRLKLSGELVRDGTFFKFESYRKEGSTFTYIEIPINRDPDLDKFIEAKWNTSVVPKETSYDENISKRYRDNNEVEYIYRSSDIKASFAYYVEKCENKENYQFDNNQISYVQKETTVIISFNPDESLLTITQQQ